MVNALAKTFNQLNRHDLDARRTTTINYLYSPAEEEDINKTWRDNETNELFCSWVEVLLSLHFGFSFATYHCLTYPLLLSSQFSTRLANAARKRVQLADEVEDLQTKGKTHFDDLYQAKEGQRIAEFKLADAERPIRND